MNICFFSMSFSSSIDHEITITLKISLKVEDIYMFSIFNDYRLSYTFTESVTV